MRMMGRWLIGRRADGEDVMVEVHCSREPTKAELMHMREYLALWIDATSNEQPQPSDPE
jgi:hypothetical protein